MSGSRKGAVVTAALTAGLVCSGGVAAAAPPDEPAGFRSVADQAAAILRGQGSDLVVQTGIYAERGLPTQPFVDIYAIGYHCVSEDSLDAAITELEEAILEGTLKLTCRYVVDPENPPTSPVPGVTTGTAVVKLSWNAEGHRERLPLTGDRDHCVGRFVERQAKVIGGVRVVVDDLGPGLGTDVDETATADRDDPDNAIRYQNVVCPPALS